MAGISEATVEQQVDFFLTLSTVYQNKEGF